VTENSSNKEITKYLEQFVSERRLEKFKNILSLRMNHIQIVLENVYQAHNASAVLRSADCFGIQYVHAIESKHTYKVSEDVAMGSGNWISLKRYSGNENNTVECLKKLKSEGFRIIATTPHEKDCNINQLLVEEKFALVFGTEQEGISQDVYNLADEFVKIPMYGFTESFNISVSAALCMYELTNRIRTNEKINWQLGEKEKEETYLNWLRYSVKNSDLVEKYYFENEKNQPETK
jgi:tRNA (guanosine-2'-O-)-methyltransferase